MSNLVQDIYKGVYMKGILTYIDIDYERGPTTFITIDVKDSMGPKRFRTGDSLRTISFLAKNGILANNLPKSLGREVDYTALTKEYTYGRPKEFRNRRGVQALQHTTTRRDEAGSIGDEP